MKRKNIISITNRQLINLERNDITVQSLGLYKKVKDKHYIIYDEFNAETYNPIRIVPSIIKIESSNLLTITKGGDNYSKLILEKGKRHYCRYQTEFGTLLIGVYTENILHDLCEKGGDIYIKYTLDVECNVTMINEVYINIKEINNNK